MSINKSAASKSSGRNQASDQIPTNKQEDYSHYFDDDFEVQVKMSAFNKAKMEFDYTVIRLRDGAVAVEGHTRNVFTDNEGHIVRLKPEWYDKIQKVYAADKAAEEM